MMTSDICRRGFDFGGVSHIQVHRLVDGQGLESRMEGEAVV